MAKRLITLFFAAGMLTAGLAAVQSAGAQQAQGSDDQARLCKIYYIENVTSRQRNGACRPGSSENEAGQCVMITEANNAFAYRRREDQSLDFGLTYWFGGGAHCGIIGNAKPAGKGWRYENNMGAADPRERCALNITPGNGYVLFQADKEASCRTQCGAQAWLDDVMLPYDAVESRSVKPQDLEPEIFYNTPCRRSP